MEINLSLERILERGVEGLGRKIRDIIDPVVRKVTVIEDFLAEALLLTDPDQESLTKKRKNHLIETMIGRVEGGSSQDLEIGMERGIILEIVTVDRIPDPHLGEDLVDFLEEIKETTDSLEAGQWVTAGLDQTQTGEGEDREETLKKDLLQNLSVDDQEAGNQKLDIATDAILRHIWVKTALVM